MSDHSQAPKRSDSFTNWFLAYTKLRFFTRMRRLLRLNGVVRHTKPPEKSMDIQKAGKNEAETAAGKLEGHGGCWMRSVKKLHFGSWEEKEVAAAEIRKMAEEDLKRRKTMAELGVIPPLVTMVGSDVVARRRVAVGALLELANGSFTNKALMVEAGLLSKLPENIDVSDETDQQELADLLLSVSALASTRFPLISTPMIPAVVSILNSNPHTTHTKQSCITTLYNLSTVLDNAGALIAAGFITALLTLSPVKSFSEKCLATLGNLVVNSAGRREMERSPMMPESLIEILTWQDKPKCQETAAYILMILAHQSSLQRRKMAAVAGVMEVLLEVALLGSPLAQKRALKIVELFSDERQRGIGPHSGPQMGRVAAAAAVNGRSGDQGRKLMKKMVKQSLHKNMEIITRRANGGGDGGGDCWKMKALVVSSSSKSLPY